MECEGLMVVFPRNGSGKPWVRYWTRLRAGGSAGELVEVRERFGRPRTGFQCAGFDF